jgi:hypothetical protein
VSADVVKLGIDRRQIAATLYGQELPTWTQRAACASEPDDPHDAEYHDSFFDDEVINATTLEFPETTLRRMRVCHTCPVRSECLAYAYAQERHVEAIPGTMPVRHRWTEDVIRYGIYGGVPGRVRERYAHHPNRLKACERWFTAQAKKRRWGLSEVIEGLWNRVGSELPEMRSEA